MGLERINFPRLRGDQLVQRTQAIGDFPLFCECWKRLIFVAHYRVRKVLYRRASRFLLDLLEAKRKKIKQKPQVAASLRQDSSNPLIQKSFALFPNYWSKVAVHSHKHVPVLDDKAGIDFARIKDNDIV